MRASPSSVATIVTALLAAASLVGVHALSEANALAGPAFGGPGSDHVAVFPRDGHSHHSHWEPLPELNETLISQWHSPTPPSYATHDFEDPDVTHKYPYLMGLHALSMSLAFLGALPVGALSIYGIALRSVNHGLHGLVVAVFYGLIALGLAFAGLYAKLTPNMYEGAKHARHGYFLIFFSLVLTTIDIFAAITRAFRFALAVRRREIHFSFKGFWESVVLNRENDVSDSGSKRYAYEYAGLVSEPEELEMDAPELKAADNAEDIDIEAAGLTSASSDRTLFRHQTRQNSRQSDETLRGELPSRVAEAKPPLIIRIGRRAFSFGERFLVIGGYAQFIMGLVTYTGVCRGEYTNGCLAHLIKGGIFWCYGLFTFARFLGAYSELGWAWNRAPRVDHVPTAEFVESTLIFIYGATNTWMERFGAKPGDPYTSKEIQHISIAVMFWFAGLVGMGLESKTMRNWLATPAAAMASENERTLTPPSSYRASFNPFPALVVGVTGLAMAAHTQVFVFQVKIHVLWGNLLASAALLRCLTYFFLWLAPPSSVLPSRPPTEALASFFLACGGLMFQMSLEELNIAAMRRDHDDVMMFLNVAVAITCLAFCWVLMVVTFKAWVKVRKGKYPPLCL